MRNNQRWKYHIRFSRVPFSWFGITNWMVGPDQRPWKYWIQFSFFTFNIQIRAHIVLFIWSIWMIATGSIIARWIG